MKDPTSSLLLALTLTGVIAAGCVSRQGGAAQKAAPNHKGKPLWADEGPEGALAPESDTKAQAYAHFAAGVSLELRGEREQAWEEFFAAAISDPSNERIVTDVVRRLFAGQKWDKALELLDKAALRPDAPVSFLGFQAIALAQTGKTDAAIAANRKAIKRAPTELFAYQNLIQIYLSKDDLTKVHAVLDEAAQQPVATPGFHLDISEMMANVVRLRATEGDKLRPKMQKQIETVAATKPTDAIIRQRMADQYRFVGDFKSAATIYLELLNENPDMPGLREKLTDAYIQGGDKAKAVEQLESVIKENPTKFPQAYYLLGVIAREDKKLEKAAENFRKVLLLRPQFEQAYYDLALVQINLEQVASALDTLDRAKKEFPRKFAQEYITAMAYNRAKNFAKGLEYLTAAEVLASATEPERLEQVYFQMGATYERMKNLAEAERFFRKALERDPESAETLNYLGYMWAEQGVRLDEARQMIEKALKLQPESAAYLDSMAWVLFKLGRAREALDYQLKSLKNSEEPDATLYDHLGDIEMSLGNRSKAVEAWKKSISIEPSEDIRKKIESAGNGGN